jgi:MarR family 2-MHQ and catechol resistance regulon transcriptional repressor
MSEIAYKTTKSEREALSLITKLLRTTNAVSSAATAYISAHQLTVSQFGVLDAVYHVGPMCQRDVAEKTLKSTANITTVIDNLEKRGLVERKRSSEDRRYIAVHITETGKQLLEDIFPEHNQRVEQCFSVLEPDERIEFARLCKKLRLGQRK